MTTPIREHEAPRQTPAADGPDDVHRRRFLGAMGKLAVALAAAPTASACQLAKAMVASGRFQELGPAEKEALLAKLEARYRAETGADITVEATEAIPGVEFGYALDLSRCVGCRRCAYACQKENNASRDPQIQWIRVLEMDKEAGVDFAHADAYYEAEKVPREGHFYLPVACQQCRNPPCTKVCPVQATWKEPDGMVVIDYDWCIGCRYCMAACPYGARRFNWGTPSVPAGELNPHTHVLGNRPRPKGVVEKCTFCIQRVRQGRYPACVEICPVGARKFGDLRDPTSEIRYVIERKRVLVLKEELNTQPRFFYFYGT